MKHGGPYEVCFDVKKEKLTTTSEYTGGMLPSVGSISFLNTPVYHKHICRLLVNPPFNRMVVYSAYQNFLFNQFLGNILDQTFEMAWQTFLLKKLWTKLEQDRIVISTRTIAGALLYKTLLYKINNNNPVVKKLMELNDFLCWEYAEKAEKEQEVAA